MGLATVNSDSPYLDGSKVKTGLNVGFVAGTQMVHGTPLYVEGGLYYTEKGGKSGSGSDKFTYNMNYLEVPLVLKYKFYPASDFTIEPFMGGYVSCGVGGKIKDFNNRAAYSSFGDKYADNFRRFDAGIKLGCGVGFDISLTLISLSLIMSKIPVAVAILSPLTPHLSFSMHPLTPPSFPQCKVTSKIPNHQKSGFQKV